MEHRGVCGDAAGGRRGAHRPDLVGRPAAVRPHEAGEDRRGISRGFTVVDHADEGVRNLCSVVGGELTTYRRMAEAVADHVRDPLGVEAACETATTPLGAVDDPDRRGECPHRDDGDPNQRSDDLVGGSRPCHNRKESSDPPHFI